MSTKKLIPSLNGVRALSVLIVAASHCGWGNIVPGGLGVTVFFFLSGYLITTLLKKEFLRTKTIGFRAFYIRRLLRLSPPLLVTLGIAMLLTSAGLTSGAVTLRGTLAQLFYMANYYQLFADFYNTIPGGTVILWSLAVEEHFYFIYPVLILCLLRWLPSKGASFFLLAVCAIVLLWRFYLATHTSPHFDRIYYASDTRVDSILWGCVLALYGLPATRKLPGPDALLFLGLGVLLLTLAIRQDLFRDTLRYTLQGLALVPIFISLLTKHHGFLYKFLNFPLVERLGEYSYSFYLIHYILVDFYGRNFGLDKNPLAMFVLVIASSFAYGKLMNMFVEIPLKAIRRRYSPEQAQLPSTTHGMPAQQ